MRLDGINLGSKCPYCVCVCYDVWLCFVYFCFNFLIYISLKYFFKGLYLFLHLSKNPKLCSTGLEKGCKPVLFYSAAPLNSFYVCYSTETYKALLRRPQCKLGQHCAARCLILTRHENKN